VESSGKSQHNYKTSFSYIRIVVWPARSTGRGGGRGAKAGRGHGRKKSEATGLPSRSGEVGACVELGNNIFTLGVNSQQQVEGWRQATSYERPVRP